MTQAESAGGGPAVGRGGFAEIGARGGATTRIAAVVVTYNRSALLMQCVGSLRAQKILPGYTLDILVIDNASTDDTLYALTPFIEDGVVRYYNTGSNLGGAGGFAFGMRAAVEEGYDLLWVMDDDCLPDAGALAALLEAGQRLSSGATEKVPQQGSATPLEYAQTACQIQGQAQGQTQGQAQGQTQSQMQGPMQGQTQGQMQAGNAGTPCSWGFLSSVVRWKDGSACAMNIQRHPLFRNIKDFSPATQPCTLASFVSLLVPAAVVREIGLPIAEFFIWTDDWEFTRRISRMFPCYVVGNSTVLHASATNSPGNIFTDPEYRLDRYAFIYRNDGVLYRGEGLKGRVYLFVRAVYHTVRVLTSSVENKKKRIQLIWNGTRAGLKFNPEIEYPA